MSRSLGQEVAVAECDTETVLSEVAAFPESARVGLFVLKVVESLKRQGRSRVGRSELEVLLAASGLPWSHFNVPSAGNVCDVLADGPRRTSGIALVEAWIARGIRARIEDAGPDERRNIFLELIPVSDHLRLLTPYDMHRMLGSFLSREHVLEAFGAMTDLIIRDGRVLKTGRGSRLRAAIVQRLETLVSVLPDHLRAPLEARIRASDGDPSVALLLDAALANAGKIVVPRPAPAGPQAPLEDFGQGRRWTGPSVEIEGSEGGQHRGLLPGIAAVLTGYSLLRGGLRFAGRLLFGLRRNVTLRVDAERLVVWRETRMLGRAFQETTEELGPGAVLGVGIDRQKSLFLMLLGVVAGVCGASAGLFMVLDGMRGEYIALVVSGLVLLGGGGLCDLAGLWLSERLGGRTSLLVQVSHGERLWVTGVDPEAAKRFRDAASCLLDSPPN